MIVDRYNAFRKLFALPGANIAIDGLPEWPSSMVNANGFDQGITITPNEIGDYIVSFDVSDIDDTPFAEEYDWFCSVRTENESGKPLIFLQVVERSGSLRMTRSEWAAAAYLNPFARSVIPALFGSCYLYVRRRTDGAIQLLDLEKYITAKFAVDDV